MPTLGTMPTREPELELTFANRCAAVTLAVEVTGVLSVTPESLLEGGAPATLPSGYVVLIADAIPFRLRGRITTVLETLLHRMSRDGSAGLIVSATAGARQPFPPATVELAERQGIPLLVTTAPVELWQGIHDGIQQLRLTFAERRAAQLASLVQELPAQLADPRAMQRIADWLARVLDVQVMVSEPARVLVASPATAAEELAQAIIRRSVDGNAPASHSGAHTQLISLGSSSAAETVLAVARRTPFDEADLRLLRHAAKLLGLVDQAHREYRAASDASRAARNAAVELLLDGEVSKARRVMRNLAPGLLDPETVRVFVVETAPTRRDAAVRRCEAITSGQALVVADTRRQDRVLVIHPVRAGDADDRVAAELTRLVSAFGPDASLGGSGVYSLSLLSHALREATTAQRFALHQPDSVALSVQDTDLVSLLPAHDAQLWARGLLHPLMQSDTQWQLLRETIPTALAYPYTVAARRLELHRNTVTRRVARAAELLNMDFATLPDRIAAALALELVTHRELPEPSFGYLETREPTLRGLLDGPQIRAWAELLLRSARADRRGLLTTATAWLSFDAHLEPTARELGVSEATVRSHIRALEGHLSRDLSSLDGMRDLLFALHVVTGAPEIPDTSRRLCTAA
ncbi:helix-turn-helix domain-containing protein [Streptomyces sp. H27-G5]|uniref:helix-turn-helix domain-containing protein n=1 Tax=Streptomyces sp. H27-G5 TaxID=2996698 RepID=UPI00226F9317|nr:helix-turn-helix domain-containing protein [Streptomyces sp. H27-G5]MCY0919002.1 helix-turn-helix domain-containing protein [Streptomyces sp. H27-G5]